MGEPERKGDDKEEQKSESTTQVLLPPQLALGKSVFSWHRDYGHQALLVFRGNPGCNRD